MPEVFLYVNNKFWKNIFVENINTNIIFSAFKYPREYVIDDTPLVSKLHILDIKFNISRYGRYSPNGEQQREYRGICNDPNVYLDEDNELCYKFNNKDKKEKIIITRWHLLDFS